MLEDLYFSLPGLSNSGLGVLLRSPAEFHNPQSNKSSAAFKFGSLFHMAILEPELFAKSYVPMDEIPSHVSPNKRAMVTAAKKRYIKANTGMEGVTYTDMATLNEMRSQINLHPLAKSLIDSCDLREHTMLWQIDGVQCKGKADGINTMDNILVDLKTTSACSLGEYQHSSIKYGYNRQAAWYLDGYKAKEFWFVAVSKMWPYPVWVKRATRDDLEQGRREYRKALEIYHKCLQAGIWPLHNEEVKQDAATKIFGRYT